MQIRQIDSFFWYQTVLDIYLFLEITPFLFYHRPPGTKPHSLFLFIVFILFFRVLCYVMRFCAVFIQHPTYLYFHNNYWFWHVLLFINHSHRSLNILNIDFSSGLLRWHVQVSQNDRWRFWRQRSERWETQQRQKIRIQSTIAFVFFQIRSQFLRPR